jgi:transcription initiation factor TFIIF subunit alpha
MSDGSKKPKIMLRMGGTSPTGSRAGSPAPGRSAGGSRAGSPAGQPQSMKLTSNPFKRFSRIYSSSLSSTTRTLLTGRRLGLSGGSLAQSPGAGPIQPHEIVAALPAAGIKIGDLMKIFQRRVGDTKGQTAKKEFIKLVKENAAFGADKLLRPK